MNKYGYIVVAAWLVLLAGCSSVSIPEKGIIAPPVMAGEGASSQTPATSVPVQPVPAAPVTPQPTQAPAVPAAEGQPVQPAAEAAIPPPMPKPVMSNNRAVIALLDRADMDFSGGKREAAGAALERALRIEPRNPWLWHQLAQVRLSQGQYAQAITLAKKSNSFSGKQHRLQADNWQLIGQSRIGQGNTSGAEEAFKRSNELAQQAQAEMGASAASMTGNVN